MPISLTATLAFIMLLLFASIGYSGSSDVKPPAPVILGGVAPEQHEYIKKMSQAIHETWRRPVSESMEFAKGALMAARATGVPEHILLGMAAIESSFDSLAGNFTCQSNAARESCANVRYDRPFGPMQIHGDLHRETFILVAGSPERAGIQDHMMAGALILKGYLDQYKNLPDALQAYNGNRKDEGMRYARKVLEIARYLIERSAYPHSPST